MNDIQELLHTGLTQVADQVHPVDLRHRAVGASRALRRRRVAVRAAAGLLGLALAVPTAVVLRDNLDHDGRTPAVVPSTESGPWLSADDVAGLTGLPQWYPVRAQPEICHEPNNSLSGWGGKPVDGAAYQAGAIGSGADTLAYRVFRFYTPVAALDAYRALNLEIGTCSPAAFQTVDGWSPAFPETANLRRREQLISWESDTYQSMLIIRRDTYLAVASWTAHDGPNFGTTARNRARVLGDDILSGTLRHESTHPLPAWALNWSGKLGPDGYGGVKLGMTLAEALATGELESPSFSQTCTSVGFLADPGAIALISERYGVVAIRGGTHAFTPEGLRFAGASDEDFRTTYPHFREDAPAVLSATVPGHPGARYLVRLLEGTGPGVYQLAELSLVRTVQDECLTRFD